MSHRQSQGFTNSNNSSLVVVATYAATIALFIIAFSLTFLGNTSSSAIKDRSGKGFDFQFFCGCENSEN